jgi:hypothetical protein
MRATVWLVTLLAAGLLVTGADAQSLTSVRGLGYPLLPTDARTEILGGLGVGLKGFSSPLTNPAAAGGILRRGASVALSSSERTIELGESSSTSGGARFPLIQVLYPVGGAVVTLGYGGYLDQAWGIAREGETVLGSETAAYSESIESTGGIGQLQLGVAVPIGSRVAVGASLGAHTGSQRIVVRRQFDTTSVGVFLQPFAEELAWGYLGPTAQVGARWDLGDVMRIGASLTWSGTVTGDSTAGRARDRELELPLQAAGGASAYLAPGLLAAVSGRWSGWSAASGGIAPVPGSATMVARDTWELGGGLEWVNPDTRSVRRYPVRMGFQYRQLPFAFVNEAPTEWFAGAGVGMRMGADASNPLAVVDLTIQRGGRTAVGDATTGDLTERVWRFALSLSLFGN